MKKVLFAFLLVFSFLKIDAQTIFVRQDGIGAGTSWNDAMGSLVEALSAADDGTEIWMAAGTYYPVDCTSCSLEDRENYFEIPSGVKIYGGFFGNETTIEDRDWETNQTILSGDIDKNNVLDSFNCFTVVYTENVAPSTLVDGVIIEQGYSGFLSSYHSEEKNGGGWFNTGAHTGNASNPTIVNCIFRNNYAVKYAGGMYNDGRYEGQTNPTYSNCQFQNNTSDESGSALLNDATYGGEASVTVTNCIFQSNICQSNGTVYNQGIENGVSNAVFEDCSFIGNIVVGDGGGVYNSGKKGECNSRFSQCLFQENEGNQGGAVYNNGNYAGSQCNPVFEYCQFIDNSTVNSGGGIMSIGYSGGSCNPEISNCIFQGNAAGGSGGAIFNSGQYGSCMPIVFNCKFFENTASSYGAAMYNMGKGGECSPKVTNCLIANNTATVSCGGIYNLGSASGKSNTEVVNCTFYHNTAQVCGALYANAGDSTGTCRPVVTNSIFYANDGSSVGKIFKMVYGHITLNYCSLDVSTAEESYDDGNSHGSLTIGEGVQYDVNPNFVDADANNFHLTSGSSVINAGTNSILTDVDVDLDNLPRIKEMVVDLGVFETGQNYEAPTFTEQPQSISTCEDNEIGFFVTAEGSETLSYQWKKNGVDLENETTDSLIIEQVSVADGGAYTCVVFDSFGAEITSETATLEVQTRLNPTVEITTPSVAICAGTGVTVMASLQETGESSTITWFKNGTPLSSSDSIVSFYNPPDGTEIYCQVVLSETCVTTDTVVSNIIEFEVSSMLSVAVEIEGDTNICEGEAVELTAVATNGGDLPQYQWQLNGEIIGEDSEELSINVPANGDEIICAVLSSLECVQHDFVPSDPVTLEVNNLVAASIVIAPIQDTICHNELISFSAEYDNEGTSPVFQWSLNDEPIGDNTSFLVLDSLQIDDVVECLLISNATCVETDSVYSNAATVVVETCIGIRENQWNDANVKIYPNPATDKLKVVLEGVPFGLLTLELFNTTGQKIYSTQMPAHLNGMEQQIDISNYPNGIYYLKIHSSKGLVFKKIIKT